MKDNYVTKWIDEMAFETKIDGHSVVMDATKKYGGMDRGPRPKPLLIAALTGCTGMDVASILNKMKVTYDSFEIETETDMTDEHPKTYTKMHLIYKFKGNDLPIKKIEKAVKLSQEKYCGVSALLEKGLELTYAIETIEN